MVVGLFDSDSLTTRPTVGNLVVQAPGRKLRSSGVGGYLGQVTRPCRRDLAG